MNGPTKNGKNLYARTKEVLRLLENTPNGRVVDADTILKDMLDESDFEVSGLARELIQIWQNASDRSSVEQLFCLFTGCAFEDYLDQCIRDTTCVRLVTDITPEHIRRAEQVLSDNGVEPDECRTVLQAIGYTLLDAELYPDGDERKGDI